MLIEEMGRGNLNTENPNMFGLGLGLGLGMGEVRLRRKMIRRNMVGTPRLLYTFSILLLLLFLKKIIINKMKRKIVPTSC